MKRRHLITAAALSAAAFASTSTWAQTGPYPNRPIKMIVPYAAGISPDVVARLMEHDPLVAEKLSQMNLRDIAAQSKYGVGAPRKDVLNAREIISKYGLSGLKDALERGEYLPAALAIPFATQDENKQ